MLVENIHLNYRSGFNYERLIVNVQTHLLFMDDMRFVIARLPFELFFFEDHFVVIFDRAVATIDPLSRGAIGRQVRALRVHPEKHVCGG
jgi:hypothetical protein